ncbi:MAG: hypothetical protein ACYCZ6_06350 [Polaromonas sp.]
MSRLEAVRQRQLGQWSSKCPAHADKGPSLSVRESTDGSVLIHCFAGCSAAEIVGSMGLEMTDLFPPRDKPASTPKKIANLLTAGQALELLADEAGLVAIAIANYFHEVALSQKDIDRLMTAAGRINLLRDQARKTHA